MVLVILGLLAGLVVTRGPPRSGALEMQRAVSAVAGAFRLARTRAIASSRAVAVRFGADGGSLQLGDDQAIPLPARIRLVRGARTMLFRPDGSASGGTVELAGDALSRQVEVNWMTGRVVIR